MIINWITLISLLAFLRPAYKLVNSVFQSFPKTAVIVGVVLIPTVWFWTLNPGLFQAPFVFISLITWIWFVEKYRPMLSWFGMKTGFALMVSQLPLLAVFGLEDVVGFTYTIFSVIAAVGLLVTSWITGRPIQKD